MLCGIDIVFIKSVVQWRNRNQLQDPPLTLVVDTNSIIQYFISNKGLIDICFVKIAAYQKWAVQQVENAKRQLGTAGK